MKATEYLANFFELDGLEPEVLDEIDSHLTVKGEKKSKVEPRFVRVEEFDATGVKLPNQAKFLLQALGDTPMTYEEWGTAAAEAGMGTKQDPARIAAYYRKTLEEAGAIARA